MTTSSETYCGFSNRETWAVNLHLKHDRFLYGMACASVSSLAKRGVHPRAIGERLVELVRTFTESNSDQAVSILRDVGSFWRVDELELGELWVSDVEEMEEFAL